jgi:hypothetical protein
MKQETAVDWFIDNAFNSGVLSFTNKPEMIERNAIIQQAKEIEKANEMHEQQIKDAYQHGQNNGWSYRDGYVKLITSEEYYEQTYKTQQQHDKNLSDTI